MFSNKLLKPLNVDTAVDDEEITSVLTKMPPSAVGLFDIEI